MLRCNDAVHLLKSLLDGFIGDGGRGYWTLRLSVDLGIVKYPTYNCINSEHIFPGLNDLLIYEETIENDANLGGQIQAIPT